LAVEAFNDLLKKHGKRGQWKIRYWITLGSMWRAIAVLLIANTAARAAVIDVVSLGPNDPTLVKVTGPLESSDKDLFLRKILPLSSAVVAFDSDGGSLVTGIQIGETIRLKNFSTLVPNGKRCASSCALAWLGGTRRFMGPESKIGFHSAYSRETRQITGPGNALVGAYLNKIGLPYNAVVYITSASPESMTWLSKADAEKLGIEVSFFQLIPTTTQKPAVLPPPTPQTRGGYLVQVSSQRNEADAQAAYRVLQHKFPAVLGSRAALVKRADLGDQGVFYRAAVGPFATPDEAFQFCTNLKSAGGQCVVQRN
jgi:sporulation related protein